MSKLGKFAFVHGKIVNINQIVEANSKVSLYMSRVVHKVHISSEGICLMLYWHKKYDVNPYEKYLYQSIGAIYVPYMSPIISIGEL